MKTVNLLRNLKIKIDNSDAKDRKLYKKLYKKLKKFQEKRM